MSRPRPPGRSWGPLPTVLAIPFLGGGGPTDDSAHFMALFEMQPDGNFLLDRARRIRRANPAAVRLFAGPGRSLAGQLFTDLIEARSREAIERALTNAIGGSAPPSAVAADARGADGTVFPVAVYVGALRKEPGEGFEVIVQDFRDRTGAAARPAATFDFGGLLVAKRLKELV